MPLSNKKVYLCIPRGVNGKGGIERQSQYLLNAWQENLEITILTTRGDGGHSAWPFVFAGTCMKLLYACAIKRDVGVLHLNTAIRASLWRKFILGEIARLFGVPTVVHLHGGGFDAQYAKMGKFTKAITNRLFRHASHCIVLGEYWRDFISKTFALPAEKISIMLNAVPAPQRITTRDFNHKPLELLFLGEVGARKGVPTLIEGLGLLKERTDWHCTIAGNGNLELYQKQAEMLGVRENIKFLGWQSPAQTEKLLEAAQVLLLPSTSENLPMAILEGMAHGLVVISTPVGAIPEVVENGVSGLLHPVGDASALSNCINAVLDNAGLAEKMSVNGQQVFREKLSMQPYCVRLAALYRSIMK
jgi:glycosyltransferase involved in cell wall biosynthesis